MKRVLVAGIGAALMALGVGAGFAAHGQETVATQTFTNVVTYTIPTITETSPPPPPQTVTVTVTATTAPPQTTTAEPLPPTAPADLYISPSGSDGSTCTQAAPCRSFLRAYARASSGSVVSVGAGVYGEQFFAGDWRGTQPAGTKRVTFRGEPGNVVRQLVSGSPNLIFDGIHVDGARLKSSGALFESGGENGVIFKNGSIGNVTDEKGAVVGGNIVFDNVRFHDVFLATEGVHNECVYAIYAEGMTVRNSVFENCATMDLFFTSGTWWDPPSPAYGNVTLEGNRFMHSTCSGCGGVPAGWHYYGLVIAQVSGSSSSAPLNGWKIRNNFFENDVSIGPPMGTGNVFCGNTGAVPAAWTAACK